MTGLFHAVLDMSMTAVPVIVVLFLLRLLLRRAPKGYSYALWAVAAFRLLCPARLPAFALSLFNLPYLHDAGTVPRSAAPSGLGGAVVPAQAEAAPVPSAVAAVPAPAPSAPAPQSWWALHGETLMTALWLAGAVCMLLWTALRLYQLWRKTRFSVRVEGNVWESDGIPGPFVLGAFRPKIFLPTWLKGRSREYVLAHERYHLRRKDPWVKALSRLILAVHWFNPAVWLMLWAVDRDMELSCDEGALRALGQEHRRDYSRTLLALGANRREFGPVLAFGAPAVKQRITHALNFKKAGRITMVLALGVLALAALTCCTGAQQTNEWAQRLYDARVQTAAEDEAVQSLFSVVWEPCDDKDTFLSGSYSIRGDIRAEQLTLRVLMGESWEPSEEELASLDRQALRSGVLMLALVEDLDLFSLSFEAVSPEGNFGQAMDTAVKEWSVVFSVEEAEALLGITDLKSRCQSAGGVAELLELVEECDLSETPLLMEREGFTLSLGVAYLADQTHYYWEDQVNQGFAYHLELLDYGSIAVDGERLDNAFHFSTDEETAVSGVWTEDGGQITLTAEDGSVYRFQRVDGYTLRFDASLSAALPLEDGAQFVMGIPGEEGVQVIRQTVYSLDTQEDETFCPCVTLRTDGTFHLFSSPLSSQYIVGTWTEQDGMLLLNRDSGGVYRFRRLDESTIQFVAEGSSEIDRYEGETPVEDGARFVEVIPLAKGTIPLGTATMDE